MGSRILIFSTVAFSISISFATSAFSEKTTEPKGTRRWSDVIAQLETTEPPLRDQAWKNQLMEASLGLTADALTFEIPTKALSWGIDLGHRFPELLKDKDFQERRRTAALKMTSHCLNQNQPAERCLATLREVANQDPEDGDLQFGLGKILREKVNSIAAIPAFSRAFKIRFQASECDDPDVKLAFMGGLGLPPKGEAAKGDGVASEMNHENLISLSQEIAFQKCFNPWKSTLLELFAKDRVNFQHNTCSHLKKRGALSVVQARLCGYR